MPPPLLTVVLIEDLKIFREALGSVCEAELNCRVIGEAETGRAAIDLILQARPDLVLLDLALEDDVDGFMVAECVRREQPDLRILAFSAHLDPYTIHRVGKCRLHGFVDKHSSSFAETREAIRRVAAGEAYFSPRFRAAQRAHQEDPRWFARVLSDTEQTMLALIGRGLSDGEIAAILDISPTTAQGHRSRILRKLGIGGTPKLVAFAIQNGFTLSRAN